MDVADEDMGADADDFASCDMYDTVESALERESKWECGARGRTRSSQGRSAATELGQRVDERTAPLWTHLSERRLVPCACGM